MQVTLKSISDTESQLVIEATREEVFKAHQEVVAKLSANVRLPGFRPGKAPAHLAVRELNQQAVHREFLQRFVPSAVKQAVVLKKLEPLMPPEVSVTKFVPEQSLTIEATVLHLGKVKLADYRKQSEKLPDIEVAPEEIDSLINKLRLDFASFKSVSRAAKKGDRLWLDFQGFDQQGQPVEGTQATNYQVVLGDDLSGDGLIPGFGEKLVGQKAKTDLEFSLRFPEEGYAAHVSNQNVNFKVSVLKVEEISLPELNEELLQKVGSVKTEEELRSLIKKALVTEKMRQVRSVAEGRLVAQLARASSAQIPQKVIDMEIAKIQQEHQQDLKNSNLTLEQWLKDKKITKQQHQKEARQMAEEGIKGGLILQQVILDEKLAVDDDEVRRVMSLQSTVGSKDQKSASQRDEIKSQLLTTKALKHLGDIVFGSPESPLK